MVDITVSESDDAGEKIPFGWEQSDLSPEDKQKLEAIMKEEEPAPATQPAKVEQPKETELTADDLPPEEAKQSEPARKYKVRFPDGEKEIEESEFVNNYLRRDDYTRKTQELSRQRAEFEAMREAMRNAPQPMLERQQEPPVPWEPDFQTPNEKRLHDELMALNSQVQGMQQARQDEVSQSVWNKLNDEVSSFKQAHPNMSEEDLTRVITVLNEGKTVPSKAAFERIFKAEFLDAEKIREEAIADYTRRLREKKAAALAPANQSGTSPKEPIDVTKISDAERYALMLKELQVSE